MYVFRSLILLFSPVRFFYVRFWVGSVALPIHHEPENSSKQIPRKQVCCILRPTEARTFAPCPNFAITQSQTWRQLSQYPEISSHWPDMATISCWRAWPNYQIVAFLIHFGGIWGTFGLAIFFQFSMAAIRTMARPNTAKMHSPTFYKAPHPLQVK